MERRKWFYIEAMGCPGNKADASRIKSFLVGNGWEEAERFEADLVVVNTCAFTKFHEDQAVTLLRKTRVEMKADARLVVAGCLGSIAPATLTDLDCERVTPRTLEEFDRITGPARNSIRAVPAAMVERGIYSLRVSNGCLGACSYCAIRIANGRLTSIPVESVISHVEEQVAQGHRQFKFVGEDVGAYGLDIGVGLPDLLDALKARGLPVKVIIDSINPQWALRYLDDLVAHMSEGLISEHIYIPFQSGSNRILQAMRRRYSVADVERIYTTLLSAVPDVQISTDIMVGFPGETDEDFRQSEELYRKYPYGLVQVFAYEDREAVDSAQMAGKVAEEVKRERREALVAEILRRLLEERNITTREELMQFLGSGDMLPVNVNFDVR